MEASPAASEPGVQATGQLEVGRIVEQLMKHDTTKAKLADGKALAKRVLADAAAKVRKIREASGVTPTLATVLVGDNASSATYVKMKRKRSEDVGMKSLAI